MTTHPRWIERLQRTTGSDPTGNGATGNGQQLDEAQSFQMIGQPSSQLDDLAAERQGWIDDAEFTHPESPAQEMTDVSDFSFFDKRANRQTLGHSIDNLAAYQQPSMAQLQPNPAADTSGQRSPGFPTANGSSGNGHQTTANGDTGNGQQQQPTDHDEPRS